MQIGIAGELRCVVTKADGTIKKDTGFQKNLILNQGLDFFGGGKGAFINTSCVIGGGNSTPLVTQTKLDSFIALVRANSTTSSYDYINKGDGIYQMWEQKRFRFTNLDNVNVSEVGLVGSGTSSSDYYLTTRTLTKDSMGNPTSITIKTGETLDIYYKIHKVIETSDKNFVVNVLNGAGAAVPYNILIRPIYVGNSTVNNISGAVAAPTNGNTGYTTSDLSEITNFPQGIIEVASSFVLTPYVPGTYKMIANINFGLAFANAAIRVVSWSRDEYVFSFMPFQMRLGRVSDDTPLTKTNKETLLVPIEISWGRYEGVL